MSSHLVIGASGKSGQHVVASLRALDASVRAGSRNPEHFEGRGFEAIRFDWHDERTWTPALEGMDGVYLVKPESADVAEIVGRFLVQMASSGVNRLVLLSECAAETRADDLPERHVELLVQASDLDWTILRPNWMMQDLVDEDFFGGAVRGRRVMEMTTGGQAIAWIDPHDIGQVAALALVNGVAIREAVYLTGPEALTLDELAMRMSAHAGGPITAVEESIHDAEERMRAEGVGEDFIRYITRISRSITEGHVATLSNEVERLTGRPPRRIDRFLTENAALLAARGVVQMNQVSVDASKLTRENEALFRRLVAAWSRNDIDDLLGCYADDLLYSDMPLPDQPVRGKAAFRAHMEAYNGLFTSGQIEVDIVTTIASSTHVAGELFSRAKYIGPGAPLGGVPVSWYATLVVSIVDGRVVTEHAYYDPTTFERAAAGVVR